MRGRVAFPLVIAASLTLASIAPARPAELPRIASLNVCTDQLLLTLADPRKFVGLSPSRATRFNPGRRMMQPTIDPVWKRRRYTGAPARYRARQYIRQTRDARAFERETASSRRIRRPANARRCEAANSQDGRNHAASGSCSHADCAARRRNRARASGRGAKKLSRIAIVAARLGIGQREPAEFIADRDRPVQHGGRTRCRLWRLRFARNDRQSEAGFPAGFGSRRPRRGRGPAFLLHPALERFYPPSKRIVVPDRLTVCGGVMLADALDVLIGELARVER